MWIVTKQDKAFSSNNMRTMCPLSPVQYAGGEVDEDEDEKERPDCEGKGRRRDYTLWMEQTTSICPALDNWPPFCFR